MTSNSDRTTTPGLFAILVPNSRTTRLYDKSAQSSACYAAMFYGLDSDDEEFIQGIYHLDAEGKINGCPRCEKQYPTYGMAEHHGNMQSRYEDDRCPTDEEFERDWALEQSLDAAGLREKHERDDALISWWRRRRNPDLYSHRCLTCDDRFRYKKDLTSHLKESRACSVATWRYKCSGCKARFQSKKYLAAHQCRELGRGSADYFSSHSKSVSRTTMAMMNASDSSFSQKGKCEYCASGIRQGEREAHMEECMVLDEKISTKGKATISQDQRMPSEGRVSLKQCLWCARRRHWGD